MKKMRGLQLCFLIVVFSLLALPGIGMMLLPAGENIENVSESDPPALFEKEGLNINFLSDAGSYFEGHYAFRGQLVTLDTLANVALFNSSNNTQVICGKNQWLYFHDTLNDYMGTDQMSDQQAETFAYNLALVKDYVESCGASFALTFPPNKNTVYSDNMPERYLPSDKPHLIDRLAPLLEAKGVNYVDLAEPYRMSSTSSSIDLFYAQDSHWNAYGSLIAYRLLVEALGRDPLEYGQEDLVWGEHRGDLQTMLFPLIDEKEYAPIEVNASSALESSETTENHLLIEQYQSNEEGTLVMYRDSFGEALKAPLASNFAHSTFYLDQTGRPFDLRNLEDRPADCVIMERVERYLPVFCADMPRFPARESDSLRQSFASLPKMGTELVSPATIEPVDSYDKLSGEYNFGVAESDLGNYSSLVLEITNAQGSTTLIKPYLTMSSTLGQGQFYVYVDRAQINLDDCHINAYLI